jgi:hypothetical protein
MAEMLFPDEALDLLREAQYDPEARRSFEELPCAFHWSDELLHQAGTICSKHESRADFYLLAFRSSLIREEPIEEYSGPWDQLSQACPAWPGFRLERSSSELVRHLERNRKWKAVEAFINDGGPLICTGLCACSIPLLVLIFALPVGVHLIVNHCLPTNSQEQKGRSLLAFQYFFRSSKQWGSSRF